MSGGSACEQCFCLGGTRRCVRPACLPPPPGCKARAASGACCPQRYYCDHSSSADVAASGNVHDCITPEGKWAYEGERVKAAEAAECMQCFCLRGAVRCQRLGCAPALRGCRPLLRPGECCPHQYQCDNRNNGTNIPNLYLQHQNTLMSLNGENRSFHTSKSTKRETTIKEQTTHKSTSAVTVTKEHPTTTVKVKRKTDEASTDSKSKDEKSSTTAIDNTRTTISDDLSTIATAETTAKDFESTTTDQPESSVKIIINGTINCTAELSSTSLLLNVSDPDMWIKSETQPRVPIVNIEVDTQSYSPNDIITERNNEEFDENETFTINVTSSLRTNTSQSSTLVSSTSAPKTVSPLHNGNANISKVKKDEYDYDYPAPTLPPSLPNLKIIPFVAADAVVDEDISSKESLDYPLLETDDKYPVYYPSKNAKQPFAMRKEDVYNPIQYPVFVSKKIESKYPSLTHDVDDANVAYTSITNFAPSQVHQYTVTAALGNSAKVNNRITEQKQPTVDTKYEMKTPAVNLFSPPIETEGGFIPKGPGIVDEYYSVYQSTPPAPVVPHLTTSMQLEPKDECITSDGRHVLEGESVNVACSVCSCAWGALRCSLRPCSTPPGCERRASVVSSGDLCCGDLICDQKNKSTPFPFLTTQNFAISLNESKVPVYSETESVLLSKPDINTKNTVNVITNYTSTDNSDKTNQEILNEFKETDSTQTSFSEVSAPASTLQHKEPPQNTNNSTEYDEEEEEEGFSFGSVLQLLLSETYETTTGTPKRKKTTSNIVPKTTTPAPTTKRKYTTPDNVFVPVTHRYPTPPKKVYPQNTVNRIDHLLLGEPTTLRKTTSRPVTTYKPVITTRKTFTTTTRTTPRPTTKTVEITNKDGIQQTSDVRPAQNFLSNLNLGLPKLAGCNIYGRMYRVGRIIAELSSPCQECKCTELGVQCRSLVC